MKNLVPVAIVLVGFAAAAVIYLLYSGMMTLPGEEIKKMNSLEIAESSLKFLNNMKRSDGRYNYSANCFDASGCTKTGAVYTQSGAWVVLVYSSLYKATGNQQYLQKMSSEADDLIKSCDGNEDECMWVLVQMIKAYQTSQNPDYLAFVKNLGDRLLTNNENKNIMMGGIEAREFALLYELTGEQKYLNEARVRLEKSKAAWKETPEDNNLVVYSDGQFNLYRFACWTELGEAEIARVANDNQALANVINFVSSAKLDQNYRNLEILTAIHPCTETLLSLYKQTADKQYYDQAKTLMQYVVTYRWDSPLSIATKYNGDGAYLFDPYTGDNLKTVTDTGYMIYLLSQMPNEQFQILSWR
jgi:lantibiotic modifying enzyme